MAMHQTPLQLEQPAVLAFREPVECQLPLDFRHTGMVPR